MSLYDDYIDGEFERQEELEALERAEIDPLAGKWVTRDGRNINLLDSKQCGDTHFENICKMVLRQGCSEPVVKELRQKRGAKCAGL